MGPSCPRSVASRVSIMPSRYAISAPSSTRQPRRGTLFPVGTRSALPGQGRHFFACLEESAWNRTTSPASGWTCPPLSPNRSRPIFPWVTTFKTARSGHDRHARYRVRRNIQGLVLVALSTWEALDQNTRDHLAIPRSWQFVLVIDQPGASALDHLARGHFLTVLICPVDHGKNYLVLTRRKK